MGALTSAKRPLPALVLPDRAASSWRAEWQVVRWLLPLALLHGLLYLVVVPPWEHYDEPTHFEYAAQIAVGELAEPGPRATEVSHAIADAMYRSGFYLPGFRPPVTVAEPIQLGESQRVHPPLYYLIVAGPIALLRYTPIEQQLYAARLISVLLYALTVLAAWRVAVAVLPDEPMMQLVIPLLLLLTPAFADLMTAVNNDVLVNFAATAMLLGCALLIRDGPRPAGLALALLGLLAALLTKRTAVPMVILCALALLWALRRRPLPRHIVLPALLLGLVALSAAAFHFEMVEGKLRLLQQPWLVALDQQYLRLRLDEWLLSVQDWERSGQLYPIVVKIVFESFWARLGWGDVGLGAAVDLLVLAFVAACAAGLIAHAWRCRGEIPLWQRRFIWLLFLAVCVAWASCVLRIHPLPPPDVRLYVPRGRYMFWATLPHLWLLALGWQGLFPTRRRALAPLLLLAAFVALDTAAWLVALSAAYYG